MKLSTGKVAFPIEFDNGDKDVIYFNPADPNLMVKINEFDKRVLEQIKEIDDIELSKEGKPIEESQIEAFDKIQNILKSELDYVFGGTISDVVFKHCSPFAIVGGQYFIIQFVEAITPEIEKHVKKANSAVEKKISRHIDKYRK